MKYLQLCIAPNFDGIGTLEHDSVEMARPDGSSLAFKFRRYCNGGLVIVNPNVLQETWLIRCGAGNGVFVRRSGFVDLHILSEDMAFVGRGGQCPSIRQLCAALQVSQLMAVTPCHIHGAGIDVTEATKQIVAAEIKNPRRYFISPSL